ncbi:L-histidine N(alpha)-methyltransferase [Microbulbifer sp. MLAF003]|uniref:L-histidine N(alpha)-methyltransferase n=1 Tax=unclassified Microbulbifer TaxID=2619833 RepID=UPI0024AE620F|nr:L-histidine N(alpha)-methyltransferase [Microbulbifer sp. MLAF003]WHI49334.1 L-histidine N(alpha)-methyltransferase [Microbulbifer sp. MLAF003]
MKAALSSVPEKQQQDSEFLRDVLEGLGGKRKTLPCKYLYDEVGSRLFEEICEVSDYYLTRTEASIFATNLKDIADKIGPEALLIEPGAGNCEKIEALLAQLESPKGYYPIDISPEILLNAERRIKANQPEMQVWSAVGDFTQPDVWDQLTQLPSRKRVVFFPGSTIGNFEPDKAEQLLELFAANLGAGDGLLIGTDLVKDSVRLERAYHDSEHVTERFNKNLLNRINTELEADFDLSLFAHRAFYHQLRKRVEMHLVSLKDHSVSVAGTRVDFSEGETIHTENSHKYSISDFNQLLARGGFRPICHWKDAAASYAIHYAQAI